MLSRLRAFNRRVVALESVAAASLLVVVFLVVLLQVAMRYLLARPNPWSEELSRLCFVWLALLGASLAVERRAHFTFELVLERQSARRRVWIRRVTTGLIALSALGLVVYGIDLVRLAASERSPALNLPVAWLYASVPVAGALMLLHLAAGQASAPDGER